MSAPFCTTHQRYLSACIRLVYESDDIDTAWSVSFDERCRVRDTEDAEPRPPTPAEILTAGAARAAHDFDKRQKAREAP